MSRFPETVFTNPKVDTTHPHNCPICVGNRERLRRDLLAKGYSDEDADRVSSVVLNPALERVYSCGWIE